MTDWDEPMSDPETLAKTVAKTVATAAGKTLTDWLKGHFNSDIAKATDTLVADPDNDSAKTNLANLLQKEIGKSPSLTDELRSILNQVVPGYAPQTSTTSGGSTNIQIQGNNNVVARGENIHQEVTTVLKGDFESLAAHLKSYHVSEQDIGELKAAISTEMVAENGSFGPEVASWVGKMVEKAASGVWQVAAGQAAGILVNALGSYYGIPGIS